MLSQQFPEYKPGLKCCDRHTTQICLVINEEEKKKKNLTLTFQSAKRLKDKVPQVVSEDIKDHLVVPGNDGVRASSIWPCVVSLSRGFDICSNMQMEFISYREVRIDIFNQFKFFFFFLLDSFSSL